MEGGVLGMEVASCVKVVSFGNYRDSKKREMG